MKLLKKKVKPSHMSIMNLFEENFENFNNEYGNLEEDYNQIIVQTRN
ncbi:MAG: hypothetical protein JXB88_08960 [Spirochaetales bacterium]|nr:hypothetical protein [Spirochaetales bacterium]